MLVGTNDLTLTSKRSTCNGEDHPWCSANLTPKIGVMPIGSPHAKDFALVSFGVAVRVARTVKGISQEELAHRCGIDRSYLGAIERGEQNSGLLHLVRIATALETTLGDLMTKAKL
jgi:DNA-binding XRE family transcriptional regulator